MSEESQIILSADGTPFKTEPSAKAEMTKRGYDKALYTLVNVDQADGQYSGFGIKKLPEQVKHVETYKRVIFSAKATVNDTENVILSVNGETLTIQRERPVVLPMRFLECADHATYEMFKQVPGQPRKVTHRIKTYPYSILGDALAEEYFDMKKRGTEKQRSDVARYGRDVTPEMAGQQPLA